MEATLIQQHISFAHFIWRIWFLEQDHQQSQHRVGNHALPPPDDEVQVFCTVTDNSTISEALVHYSVDGGTTYNTVLMNADAEADSVYTGVIPCLESRQCIIIFLLQMMVLISQSQKQAHCPMTLLMPTRFQYYRQFDNRAYPRNNLLSRVSLYEGCTVTVSGVVTGDIEQHNSSYGSYAFQDGSGQWRWNFLTQGTKR